LEHGRTGPAVEAKFDFRRPSDDLPPVAGERASINYVPGGPTVSVEPAAESRMPIMEM
jgi:hypothetical protein